MNRKKSNGFTMFDLMIVIAIIAILAAILIPGLLRARVSANEGSAIGTLRTISTAQAQFQNSAIVDQDEDGSGEYGTLGELAGTCGVRSGPSNKFQGSPANPSFITSVLGPEFGSHGNKSGYTFQIFLPGTGPKDPITDNGRDGLKGLSSEYATVDSQEMHHRTYAWPINQNETGIRCFAVDQSGEVLAAPNQNPSSSPYSGSNNSPSFDAAVDAKDGGNDGDSFEGIFKAGVVSVDNQIWTSAGG